MPDYKYLDYIQCTAYNASMQINCILTDIYI